MTKTLSVECDDFHCDETNPEECRYMQEREEVLQEVFDRTHPDKGTDWRKCRDEPWWSLSGALR